MSYDLDFWKYSKGVYLDNQEVYTKCCEGLLIDGLEIIPTELIIQDIQQVFENWRMIDSKIDFENPNGSGSFQIYSTQQFIRFDCYNMDGEDMNKLIDVMNKYNCPLYDPQVPQRFDGK